MWFLAFPCLITGPCRQFLPGGLLPVCHIIVFDLQVLFPSCFSMFSCSSVFFSVASFSCTSPVVSSPPLGLTPCLLIPFSYSWNSPAFSVPLLTWAAYLCTDHNKPLRESRAPVKGPDHDIKTAEFVIFWHCEVKTTFVTYNIFSICPNIALFVVAVLLQIPKTNGSCLGESYEA